jgi:two-component system response regulator DegU
MSDPIRLAIADDEALFRRGIALLCQDFDGIELVMEASNGQELLEQARHRRSPAGCAHP